jgi:hypothetical protein
MKTINRTVITIIPKQPYISWANSFDDNGPKIETDKKLAISILISDKYDEYNYEKFIKKNYSDIFEEELDAWMSDPDDWPKNRTYQMFNEWFEVLVSEFVIDMGDGSVEHEPF